MKNRNKRVERIKFCMFCHLTVALWKAQSKVEEWADVKVMAATWKNTANQFEAELGAYKCICEELNAAK